MPGAFAVSKAWGAIVRVEGLAVGKTEAFDVGGPFRDPRAYASAASSSGHGRSEGRQGTGGETEAPRRLMHL